MGNQGPEGSGRAADQKTALAGFANASANVVHTAAGILEREIAAGIKAAQEVSAQMEVAFGKTSSPTPANFLEIIDRFERDAQEAVTVLATLFRTVAKALENMAGAAATEDKK